MKSINKKTLLKSIAVYLIIALVATMHAFETHLFVVPNNFAPSGLNGIATMVQYKTGFSIGYMSLLINIPLCIFAYFFVEKSFATKSLTFCAAYALAYLCVQKMGLEEFRYYAGGHNTMFPVLISGVLLGFVYGTCFRLQGSTGGTDIISKYISKLNPELNFFWINFSINAVVAASSFFVYAQPNGNGGLVYDYQPVFSCMIYCFVTSFVGNYIIKGTRTAIKFTIVTSHPDAIIGDIMATLKHGVTKIDAIGSYSNDSKVLLICVVNKNQIVDFKNILKKYDDTFSFSETVNDTYGNFKQIKK